MGGKLGGSDVYAYTNLSPWLKYFFRTGMSKINRYPRTQQQEPKSKQTEDQEAQVILDQYGVNALRYMKLNGRWVKLLNDKQIASLRWNHMSKGQNWPYEHIWPGMDDRWIVQYQKYQEKLMKLAIKGVDMQDVSRTDKLVDINNRMEKMEQMIADMQADRKLPWDKINLQDKVLLSSLQQQYKYVKGKLDAKQQSRYALQAAELQGQQSKSSLDLVKRYQRQIAT